MTVSVTEPIELLEPMVPHDDQEEAIAFILENKEVLLKAPTGAGKTLVGTESAIRSGAQRVLIVGPLNTESSWRKTVARQSEYEIELKYCHTKRVANKRHLEDLHSGKPGWYFIGREFFKNFSWKKVKGLDCIIFDECHVATNNSTKMWKMLMTSTAPIKLAMSATPAGNKLEGIWALARWLWPKKTPRGFWNWVTQYFTTEFDPHAVKILPDGTKLQGKKVTGEREKGLMWSELPAAYKMPSVYKDKPTIHEIEVELSAAQRKHYKDLEEEAITWLDNHPLAVDVPAVLHMRLRQLCLAVPSVRQDWVKRKDKDTGLWEDVWGDVVWFEDDAKSTKIDALVELLSDLYAEKPFPVVVYTDSRIFATICTKQLQAKGFNARRFVGGMPADERAWKKDKFGEEYDVVVCTIPAVAEGLDGWQYVCSTEVWMNYTYSNVLNHQAEGRTSRQGQTESVQRYVIKAKDTVEVRQIGKLKSDAQKLAEGYGDED